MTLEKFGLYTQSWPNKKPKLSQKCPQNSYNQFESWIAILTKEHPMQNMVMHKCAYCEQLNTLKIKGHFYYQTLTSVCAVCFTKKYVIIEQCYLTKCCDLNKSHVFLNTICNYVHTHATHSHTHIYINNIYRVRKHTV